jgi:hypothetical protein
VIRQRGVVYDVGRSMDSLSMNWRPDYTPALMRRELDIVRTGLRANAVRLGGRDARRLLAAAACAASIGLNVWLGPSTARHIPTSAGNPKRPSTPLRGITASRFYRAPGGPGARPAPSDRAVRPQFAHLDLGER